MADENVQYDDKFTKGNEVTWGEGFLAPGGAEEVCRILEGVDLGGKEVLDIGAGLGGPSFCLVDRLGAARVVGIDIEPQNIPRAEIGAEAKGLSDRVTFQRADACALPFPENSFDVVFNGGGVFCETTDKKAGLREVYRVLRPGGWFAANDWFHGGEPFSEEFQKWIGGDALIGFQMITCTELLGAMKEVGFVDITSRDRNGWYREESRHEVERMSGPDRPRLEALLGKEGTEQWIAGADLKATSVEKGDLRPHHFRGRKPE